VFPGKESLEGQKKDKERAHKGKLNPSPIHSRIRKVISVRKGRKILKNVFGLMFLQNPFPERLGGRQEGLTLGKGRILIPKNTC